MGIQEELRELKEIIKEKEGTKDKKFRIPFGKKVGKGQRKKNYITVVIIYENGTLDFKKCPIEDQTFIHEGIPRLAAAGYVMYYKKNPFVILPNWSVEPFSPMEHYKNSLLGGQNTTGYKILMAKMEAEKVTNKPKMGGFIKWIIGFGLVAIIVYAIFSGGSG